MNINDLNTRLEMGGSTSEWRWHQERTIDRTLSIDVRQDGLHVEMWEDGAKVGSTFFTVEDLYNAVLGDL